MKKKWIIISVAAAVGFIVALSVVLGVFHYYHPTHYKFNDRFIIGNTMENIVEKYGEFHNGRTGYYLAKSDAFTSYEEYYIIDFEDGIAVDVRIGYIPGG